MERLKDNKTMVKLSLIGSLLVDLGLLIYFKYTNFLIESIGSLCTTIGVQMTAPVFDIVLLVGISFYTFQDIGYTIDVYRGRVEAEKNPFRYALFLSFFPQLVAGPIERSSSLLTQIREQVDESRWDYDRIANGLIVMLWALFMKVVIADCAAILVDYVFARYERYGFVILVIAALLFPYRFIVILVGILLSLLEKHEFSDLNLWRILIHLIFHEVLLSFGIGGIYR